MNTKAKSKLNPQTYFWENFFTHSRERTTLSAILKKNVLFEDLSNEELRYLERIVHVRHYEPGEYVFQQNERALGMYIITSGKVNVLVHANNNVGVKLRETLITTLSEGAFFGEHSLIENEAKRTASTIAAEPTSLIAFLKPDLMDIVQRRPIMGLKITLQLAKVLSMRLRKTTEKLSEITASEEAHGENSDE